MKWYSWSALVAGVLGALVVAVHPSSATTFKLSASGVITQIPTGDPVYGNPFSPGFDVLGQRATLHATVFVDTLGNANVLAGSFDLVAVKGGFSTTSPFGLVVFAFPAAGYVEFYGATDLTATPPGVSDSWINLVASNLLGSAYDSNGVPGLAKFGPGSNGYIDIDVAALDPVVPGSPLHLSGNLIATLDHFEMRVTPVPPSMVLFGTGILAVAAAGARRRRQQQSELT